MTNNFYGMSLLAQNHYIALKTHFSVRHQQDTAKLAVMQILSFISWVHKKWHSSTNTQGELPPHLQQFLFHGKFSLNIHFYPVYTQRVTQSSVTNLQLPMEVVIKSSSLYCFSNYLGFLYVHEPNSWLISLSIKGEKKKKKKNWASSSAQIPWRLPTVGTL